MVVGNTVLAIVVWFLLPQQAEMAVLETPSVPIIEEKVFGYSTAGRPADKRLCDWQWRTDVLIILGNSC